VSGAVGQAGESRGGTERAAKKQRKMKDMSLQPSVIVLVCDH
jgi:hypothetical protein